MSAVLWWMLAFGQLHLASGAPKTSKQHQPRINQDVGTWSNAIVPYEISPDFSLTERLQIGSAINDLHRFSCVRWVPLQEALASPAKDYVFFTPGEGKKCSSHVGRVAIGKQTLQLAPHCFQRSTILHEMMHSLGFHHEHARRDRSPYIKILWHNVNPNHTTHFKVHNMGEHTYNTPYDYTSVMHYDSLMGTGNGGPTILKQETIMRQLWGFDSLGQEHLWIRPPDTLSLMDAVRLNLLYNCDVNGCQNYYPYCNFYETLGACTEIPQFMDMLCKNSCGRRC